MSGDDGNAMSGWRERQAKNSDRIINTALLAKEQPAAVVSDYNNMSKLSQYGILYVDDEVLALKYFEKGFAQSFKVFTANNAAEGWSVLQQHHSEIGIVMADQRMPGQSGVELLEKIRYAYPQVVRMLATAYSDVESAIAGVNAGAIYRYVSKPWDVDHLRIDLLRALEFYGVLKERDQLLREKLSVLQQIILSNRVKNLAVLAAGLAPVYRRSLEAAQHFVDSIPQISPETAFAEPGRGGISRNFEVALRRASDEIFHLASTLKEIAAERTAPGEAVALETLFAPETSATPNAIVWSATSPVSRIQGNPKEISKLFLLLAANIRAVGEKSAVLRAEASEETDANGSRLVKIVLADDAPEWTLEQWCRFFSPFTLMMDPTTQAGLDLAACYFIAYHGGGRIEVLGKPESRVIVYLAVEPPKSADQFKKPDLERLFRYEQGGENLLG